MPPPDRPTPETLPAPPPPRILVVEDDHDFRLQMADCLRREGYRVRSVPTGEEGLHALSDAALPDLVLLDLGLPRMSGAEFLAAKARYHRWARIPVVVVSARLGDDRPTDVVSAVLPKPVDWEALLDVVHHLCTILGRGGDASDSA